VRGGIFLSSQILEVEAAILRQVASIACIGGSPERADLNIFVTSIPIFLSQLFTIKSGDSLLMISPTGKLSKTSLN
jgi:hypothetical protein